MLFSSTLSSPLESVMSMNIFWLKVSLRAYSSMLPEPKFSIRLSAEAVTSRIFAAR